MPAIYREWLIDRALDAAGQQATGTQQDMERLLAIKTLSDLASERQRLNDLLERGGISIEERSILKRGLLFMGRGMHREAAEWWTLNSPDDTSTLLSTAQAAAGFDI